MALNLIDFLLMFVCIQVILVPILGGLYLGIKSERMKNEALFHKALYAIKTLRRPYA